MVTVAIVLMIFFAAFGSALFLARRRNAAVGILGGLGVGVACWAIAAVGMFVWFANS